METKPKPIRNILFLGLIVGLLFFYARKKYFPETAITLPTEAMEAMPFHPVDEETVSPDDVAFWKACIECAARHSSRVYASYDRYLSWTDPKTGPNLQARHLYGLYETYDPRDCAEDLKSRLRRGEYPVGLDEAAGVYVFDLERIYRLCQRMNRYYTLEDYKDDKMAFGKLMHDSLIIAFRHYHQADSQLWAGSAAFFEAQLSQEIAREDTASLRGKLLRLQRVAFRAEAMSRVSHRSGLNAALLDTVHQDLEQVLGQLEIQVKGLPPNEANRFHFLNNSGLSFLKAVKNMVRERSVPYDKGGKRWGNYYNDDPLLNDLSSKYNHLAGSLGNLPEGLPAMPVSQRFFWRSPDSYRPSR